MTPSPEVAVTTEVVTTEVVTAAPSMGSGGHFGGSNGNHFGGSNGGRLGGHFGGGQRDHQRSGSQPAVAGSPALISPFVVTRPDDPASDCRLNERVLIGGQWVWEDTQIC